MASKNTSLANRMNGQDRMSRAVGSFISTSSEETKDKTITNDKPLVVANVKVNAKANPKNNTKTNDKPKGKPIIKPLVKPNINVIVKEKTIEKDIPKDIDKDLEIVKDIDNTNDIINTNTETNALENTNINTIDNAVNNTINNDNTNTKELTFVELLINKIGLIEGIQKEEARPISLSEKKEKVKFDDKFPIMSFPARKEMQEVIDMVSKHTGLKKYQIIELALLKGLRSIFE
jgi:hypothetical protein